MNTIHHRGGVTVETRRWQRETRGSAPALKQRVPRLTDLAGCRPDDARARRGGICSRFRGHRTCPYRPQHAKGSTLMSVLVNHRSAPQHDLLSVEAMMEDTGVATEPAVHEAPGRETTRTVARPSATTASPSRAGKETDAAARALLVRLTDLAPDCPDRPRIRARVIEMYLPLAEYLARRFRNRGEPLDDLVQVANLGLIKSVDGYDVTRGAAFTSYAIPMIVGELKRHFRDKGWDVRVPRRLQELRLEITKASGDLAQQLGRSPTVADLAAHLNVSEEDIIEGLDSAHAYRALSLHAPVAGEEATTELVDLLGDIDRDMENVEDREALRPLIAKLP